MKNHLLSLACAIGLGLITTSSFAHSNSASIDNPRTDYVSIKFKDYKSGMLLLKKLDIDVTGVDVKNSIADIFATGEQMKLLEKSSSTFISIKTQKKITKVDTEYKSPSEIETILKNFESTYPEVAKVHVIGTSAEGRNIYAMKISDNVADSEIEESSVLFNSMHHAREVMSPEVSLDIIETLLTKYSSDLKIQNYVDSNEIWVVPMLNVDGNAKVWAGSNMWRKNTNYGHGVDINRNYPHLWGACNGSSGSTWSSTYRGPEAGSEPETQALMNLVKEIRPVFDISYHAYSELVIYPMGCKGQRTHTKEIVEKIGKQMGAAVNYAPGTAWELLYSVDGSDIDWMYNAYQVIPYVLEVNSRREGFQPSYSKWRDKTVQRNRAAWMLLLDRMNGTGVKGLLDETFVTPQSYEIEVKKEDGTIVQNYRVNPNGSFHIVLNPGSYTFSLKKGRSIVSTKSLALENLRVDLQF
ncbi:M14 family metallopeptidase [Halobacteriovorax sp. HLS]|uniref:M14 family metallopeptidase n=1 Tax=Halobacteriovorax sp. HLS TaxID=2234000 RepID=UPI000FD9E095|nr:M14 family metallopeptidase [Halobacteriovorax sp. HLS]